LGGLPPSHRLVHFATVLIVAIHDVAPAELSNVRWLLAQLDDLGVARRVLKVVAAAPDAPASDEVVELLHAEQEAGSEIVLHGWTHRAAGHRLRGSTLDQLRGRLFAGGAAEFLSLPERGVAERVAVGADWLRHNRFPVGGFCPPAWLATEALKPALRANGFRYLVTLRGLLDLRSGRRVILPPAGYMGAGAAQEAMVRLAAAVLSRPARAVLRSPAQRIFLHPQGAASSPDCARVLARIGVLARRHRSITYGELIDV
jgi:predicted deacetylase